jgi:uncharacterized protein (DUF433 family)
MQLRAILLRIGYDEYGVDMTILDTLVAEAPPIANDADGVARVGQTRVRLDTVITAFNAGLGAEEILLKYPSLQLPDVYSVLAYYLRHRTAIDQVLEESRERSEQAAIEIESRFPSEGIRERLLARRPSSPVEPSP